MRSDYIQSFTCPAMPERYRGILDRISLVYETYGRLNAAGDNAVLVVHGFSASSHVARHGDADAEGWWDWAVGPGRPLDTSRYFVVCANNLGSCFGSSGPADSRLSTGWPLASGFPFPTVADIVFCLHELQKGLGIKCWRAVIGGSLGGMAALQWARSFPGQAGTVVCLNAGARLSHVGAGLMDIQADLMAGGGSGGLRLARRIATLSYLGEEYFRHLEHSDPAWRLTEWLDQEAAAFADRFDSYSYRGFLHAMREFDCSAGPVPALPRMVLVGCYEDILFPAAVIQETADRFSVRDRPRVERVHSIYGHDSFLQDESLYAPLLRELFAG